MLKLLDAAVEEHGLEGLIIAADWEKAFDRVSWEYLHEATAALGFGPMMRGWFEMMYNEHKPPALSLRTRRCMASK